MKLVCYKGRTGSNTGTMGDPGNEVRVRGGGERERVYLNLDYF